MSFAWTLTLLVAGPTFYGPPVEAPVPDAAAAAAQETPARLRAAYREALRQTARRVHPDPYVQVPALVDLYRRLDNASGMAHSEKARMLKGLESRLADLHTRLLSAVRRRKESDRLKTYRASRAGRTPKLAGPAELSRAQELIELIQNTIAPESWKVNGGNGSISYYAPLKVLVIRQSGEVHHQIGGALRQLRK